MFINLQGHFTKAENSAKVLQNSSGTEVSGNVKSYFNETAIMYL